MRNFVILSAVNYNSMRQRPQHFADYLSSMGFNVFYFSLSATKKILQVGEFDNLFVNGTYKHHFNSPKKNLFVAKHNIFKNNKNKGFDDFLADLEQELGSENTVFWACFPDWDAYVGKLSKSSFLLYDCIDDWEAFFEKEDFMLKSTSLAREKHLASISKCVIGSAWKLCLKMSYLNNNVYYLPNGTSIQDYAVSTIIPSDLKDICKPIALFVGALSAWIDYELIDYIAQKRPNYSFVYLGPALNTEILPQRDNIYYLGRKNYTELPSYMKEAKVGIIPFEVTKLSVSVTPLKYFEYCSAGLPTVMTIFPDIYNLSSGETGLDKDDFVKKLDMIMDMKDEDYAVEVEKAKFVSKDFEWQVLLDKFLAYLDGNAEGIDVKHVIREQINVFEHFTMNNAMKNELIELYNRIEEYEKAAKIGEELVAYYNETAYEQLIYSYAKLGNTERALELFIIAANKKEKFKPYCDLISNFKDYTYLSRIIEVISWAMSGNIYIALNQLDTLISETNNELLYGLLSHFYGEIGEFLHSFNALAHLLGNYEGSLKYVLPKTLELLAEYLIYINELDGAEDIALLLIEKGYKKLGEEKLADIYLIKAIPIVEPTVEKESTSKVETWDKIWDTNISEWDENSEEIYQTLKSEIGDFKGKKILEAGSGSGRISLRMAQEGAEITLLDFSNKALEVAKMFFSKKNLTATYINGDLTKPLPFKDNSFDIVFNAGVMEHFLGDMQNKIVGELSRVGKEFHTFNPNRNSFFYTLGKWIAELRETWEYGDEFPVVSFKKIFDNNNLILDKEYDICHSNSLNFLTYMDHGDDLKIHILSFLSSISEEERTEKLKQMGGYLLYSKGIKK